VNPLPPLVVVAAIIQRDARFLICQRRARDSFGLLWEFPGGKIQPGESPEAALERELFEELGAHARVGPLVYETRHAYPEMGREVQLLFFVAELGSQQINNLAFEQTVWAEQFTLPQFEFLPADKQLAGKLARGELGLPSGDW